MGSVFYYQAEEARTRKEAAEAEKKKAANKGSTSEKESVPDDEIEKMLAEL